MIGQYTYQGDDPAGDIRTKYGSSGDLVDLFANHTGHIVHKWHHFIPVYERYFAPYRNTPVKFLEIGVSKGGSMEMWRKYFGPDAVIYGIDINENCAQFDGLAGQVRIGSQDDPEFLRRVVDEMGGVDVVLDDGSHVMKHLRASLEVLFPLLPQNGLYMIEDLHTAYWRKYGGGSNSPDNFFSYLRGIVDDMHRWYDPDHTTQSPIGQSVSSIHIYDSIAVIEKSAVHRPVHSRQGGK